MARAVVTLALLSGIAAGPLHAQWQMPALVSFSVGAMRYTMSDTRTGTVVALRLDSPVVPLGRRNWLIEASGSYAWYLADDGSRRHLLVPEMQVQFQAGPPGIQPYIGAGGGIAHTKIDTVGTTKLTASAAVGLRLLAAGWGIAGEIRFRSVDLFHRTTRELTVSLIRQLE